MDEAKWSEQNALANGYPQIQETQSNISIQMQLCLWPSDETNSTAHSLLVAAHTIWLFRC